jgi:hypothetical protein
MKANACNTIPHSKEARRIIAIDRVAAYLKAITAPRY